MGYRPRADVVGIIPAAGAGTRLAPYPNAKELFPIGYQLVKVNDKMVKRPKVISQYLVENMMRAGVSKVFFVIGQGKHDLVDYYGSGEELGAHISYLYQRHLKGMPYAIDLATPWLDSGATVVMGMPDTVIEPPDAIRQLLSSHMASQADLTLGLFHTDQPRKFGMVAIDDNLNIIEHIDKPQETDLEWLWGLACWGPRFTALLHMTLRDHSADGHEVVLGDVFDSALAHGYNVKGFPFEQGRYIDIGTYDDLRHALLLYS